MTVLYSNPCYKEEVCYMLVVPVFVVLPFQSKSSYATLFIFE